MNIKEFYNLAKNHFSFKLTAKQDLTLYKLSEFILNDDDNSLFSSNQWNLSTGATATFIVVKK